jgi:hypothetical protein
MDTRNYYNFLTLQILRGYNCVACANLRIAYVNTNDSRDGESKEYFSLAKVTISDWKSRRTDVTFYANIMVILGAVGNF